MENCGDRRSRLETMQLPSKRRGRPMMDERPGSPLLSNLLDLKNRVKREALPRRLEVEIDPLIVAHLPR